MARRTTVAIGRFSHRAQSSRLRSAASRRAHYTFTVKDFIAASVIGDPASVRVRTTSVDDARVSVDDVALFEYVREDDQWMFCAATDQ